MAGEDDFSGYRRLILDRLDRQDAALRGITEGVNNMREDIVLLKFKSGLWGSLAGAVVSIVVALVVAYVKGSK